MKIGFANSKGGVGKSTLARNLLVYLTDEGQSTALVDAEENAPTATLLQSFDPTLVTRSATTLDAIDDAVEELSANFEHVILDAPGKEGDQVSTLCLLSDLVIIPLCVSEQDLLQTVGVINLVRRQQRRSKDGRPEAAIVLTRTRKNDIAAPGFRSNLERYGIPVAATEIRELLGFKRNTSVMRDPTMDGPTGPASDIRSLVKELIFKRQAQFERAGND